MRGWSLGKVSDQTQGTIHLSASHEFGTATILPGKMPADHFVRHGQKLAMNTCRTFHTGLIAETSHPSITTRRSVTGLPCCPTFNAAGYTSSRPRNRERKSAILASGEEVASEPRLVMLSFVGNLHGELAGRDFRFEVRERDLPNPRPVLDEHFHNDQVGPMGDSLYRMVRVPLIPIEEFYMARKRGETPPEEQRASIYLEWYSQNGRVVLELLDPILEFAG